MKRIGLSVLCGVVVLAAYAFAASTESFRITAIAIEGDNVRVTWLSSGTNNFTTFDLLSGATVTGISNYVDSVYINSGTNISTNLVEIGGATNGPTRFYRVQKFGPG